MKLIIQIPCHNEATTLPATIRDLPREIDGVTRVEFLIINDGSTDDTVEVARNLGVDHIIHLPQNQGLAKAFEVGIRSSLARGADIIVNTDGDNQYHAGDIPALIRPILKGEADMVIGARPINEIPHFSYLKKILQRLGSWFVRRVSGTQIPDATSGFRAYSRFAAARLNVFSHYTYTLETIIQAGHSDLTVASVPIRVNPPARESRLIRSIFGYIKKSIFTMFRIFLLYRPLRFFATVGGVVFSVGFLLGLRFLYFFFIGEGGGHLQSLILAAVLLLMGFQLVILGLVADLISFNRRILEDIQFHQRQLELKTETDPKETPRG